MHVLCHATARARLDAATVNSKLGPFIKMQHIAYSLVNTNCLSAKKCPVSMKFDHPRDSDYTWLTVLYCFLEVQNLRS